MPPDQPTCRYNKQNTCDRIVAKEVDVADVDLETQEVVAFISFPQILGISLF